MASTRALLSEDLRRLWDPRPPPSESVDKSTIAFAHVKVQAATEGRVSPKGCAMAELSAAPRLYVAPILEPDDCRAAAHVEARRIYDARSPHGRQALARLWDRCRACGKCVGI